MMLLLKMFWTFFGIGAVTFGGGYSMLPMLIRECVEKHKWTSESDLLDYYALGQLLPGLIAVNTAGFIGYQQKRIPGVIACGLGVVTPSILVIILVAMVLERLMGYPIVQHAFAGIRLAVGAMILGTVIRQCKSSIKSIPHIALAIAAFVASLLNISTVAIVLISGAVGVALGRRIETPELKTLLAKVWKGGEAK